MSFRTASRVGGNHCPLPNAFAPKADGERIIGDRAEHPASERAIPASASDEPAAARLRSLFASFVAASQDLIAFASGRHELLYVNDAGLAMLGTTNRESELAAFEDLFAPGDLAYVREVILGEFARKRRWAGDFRIRDRRDGSPLPVHLTLFAIRGNGDGEAAIAILARDISGRRRSEARLRFLVDAGAALSLSLDYVETFANLAQLIVKSLASYCFIDVFRQDGEGAAVLERAASAHVDLDRRAVVERLGAFLPPADVADPIREALYDGASSLVSTVDAAWIARTFGSSAHADVLASLGTRSLVTVPLVAAGEVVGALTCALAAEREARPLARFSYDAEDLFFIEELGRRAGASLVNARLYERERRIAVSMQAASLPQALPRIAGVRIDAEYRPGSAEATIGGDWYDAFMLGTDRIALTVGDVVGHGLVAAMTMTKLRQAMQSAAMVDADPATMLRVANQLLLTQYPDSHATALACIFEPNCGTLTYASAGHPAPLLRTSDGAIVECESSGVLLGIDRNPRFECAQIRVPRGSLLLLFTDGLIEETRDVLDGYGRVRDAMNARDVRDAASASTAVVSSVLGRVDARDDIAVLAVRLD